MLASRKLVPGVLAALSLFLVSCGSTAPPLTSASPAGAPNGTTAPAANSASGAPIKVGLIEATTGPTANLGLDNKDGFNLYLASQNNQLAGRPIEVHSIDTAGQADAAVTKTTQLVENDRVDLLMGLTGAADCYAIAGYLQTAQVPLLVTDQCGNSDLTLNSKYASPYLTRWTYSAAEQVDPAAEWAWQSGYHTVDLVTLDYVGGLQVGDFFGSAFVRRGGTILQELHPPVNTVDWGPYIAQLDESADALAVFANGTDGLRFVDAYATYAQQKKPVLDLSSGISTGSNIAQLKDKALGIVSFSVYSEDLQTPANQTFLKAWSTTYRDRAVSVDAASGWVSGQVLDAALRKVNGDISNKQAFLDALYSLNLDTAKGPVKLDNYHDIVQNAYVNQVVDKQDGYGVKLIGTYPDQNQLSDRTAEELLRFPFGSLKGQWVGMTKEKLAEMQARVLP